MISGRSYYFLGTRLGIKKEKVESIRIDTNVFGIRDGILKLLQEWHKVDGSAASLKKTLLVEKQMDAVDYLNTNFRFKK